MLAFHTSFEAACWCIDNMEVLKRYFFVSIFIPILLSPHSPPFQIINLCLNSETKSTVQLGIHTGKFEDCRPHPLTGSIFYIFIFIYFIYVVSLLCCYFLFG